MPLLRPSVDERRGASAAVVTIGGAAARSAAAVSAAGEAAAAAAELPPDAAPPRSSACVASAAVSCDAARDSCPPSSDGSDGGCDASREAPALLLIRSCDDAPPAVAFAAGERCGVGASLIGDGSSADPGVPRLLRSERNGRRSQELPPPQEFIVDGGASLAEGFCPLKGGVSACAPATVSPSPRFSPTHRPHSSRFTALHVAPRSSRCSPPRANGRDIGDR